jgi:methyl-accepting chemotaxis protein
MESRAEERAGTGGFGIESEEWFDVMTEKIDLLKGVEDRLSSGLVTRAAELRRAAQNQLWLFGAIAAVVVVTTLAVALGFVKSILKTLGAEPREMTSVADRVSRGDLSIQVNGNLDSSTGVYRSMLGVVTSLQAKAETLRQIADRDLTVDVHLASDVDGLGNSLAQMRSALHEVMSEVMDAVNEVSEGASQVAQASSTLSEGATEQASSIQEISSSTHEINARSRENAESADQARKLADDARTAAEKANSEMTELNTAIEEIAAASSEITSVVKVIDDIAFQINLLSLNANVEAARAGKYGRGFAVVAEEVRALANRSGEAVVETRTMVERSNASVARGSDFSRRTSSGLEEILAATTRVASVLGEIAAASREQSLGVEQMTEGLDQIDQVTQSNTASAEQSAAAAEQLSDQAEHLRAIIRRFKLRGNAATAGSALGAATANPGSPRTERSVAERTRSPSVSALAGST